MTRPEAEGLAAPAGARRYRLLLVAAALLLQPTPPAAAQEPPQDLRQRLERLEQQNSIILERLEASELRNAELEAELEHLHAAQGAADLDAELERSINSLSTGVEQVTWDRLTRSGNPITFYGFVRLDAYFNTARANSIIIPAVVLPENGVDAEENDAVFALDARLTRIGLEIDAGSIGSARATGRIETDFSNFVPGVPESREAPRMRLGYFDLDFGDVALRVGQDWDMFAPLYPAVHAQLLLWNAGNPGDRRPQVQLAWQEGDPEGTLLTLEAGAGLQGAINNLDLDAGLGTFTSTERDGFDAGHPHGQARAALAFSSWVPESRGEIGVWGVLGALETDTSFAGEDDFTVWLAGLDWTLPLWGPVTFRGEAWAGEAPGDLRAGIGQTVNPMSGEEIRSYGGWAEIHWQTTDSLRLAAGASLDDPDAEDLMSGSPEQNFTVYLSSKFDWGGGLFSGFDVLYWETEWVGEGIGNMLRFNAWTQLNF